MANGARCSQAIRNDDGRFETRELGGAPTRELAQRLTGAVEVLLLWHPDIDSVELSLQDRATGAGCEVEIAPQDALDAFYHPYAYVSGCAVPGEDEWTIDDG